MRNNPGIYKVFRDGKHLGKFLSTRRVWQGRKSVREKAVFDNIADAKEFRSGRMDKKASKGIAHKVIPLFSQPSAYTFGELVEDWKKFHFLTLEQGTKLLYERKLPFLAKLHPLAVEDVDVEAIDELVQFWVKERPRRKSRQSFEKELNLLTVVLNFYKSRKNRAFAIPIQREHYEASTVVRKAKGDVQALSEQDLARFLGALKLQKNPIYFPLAASQFGLSLRIGEVCGLDKRFIDLSKKEVRIGQTVIWNDRTWEAEIKPYPKNDYVRYLSISDFLVDIWSDWIAMSSSKSTLMFYENGVLLNRKTIATAYNRTLKELGIDYVSGTQMMRRTSATHANEATGDFFAVSVQLDHSSPEVTKRYVKRISSQKVKVASALNDVYLSSVRGNAEVSGDE